MRTYIVAGIAAVLVGWYSALVVQRYGDVRLGVQLIHEYDATHPDEQPSGPTCDSNPCMLISALQVWR